MLYPTCDQIISPLFLAGLEPSQAQEEAAGRSANSGLVFTVIDEWAKGTDITHAFKSDAGCMEALAARLAGGCSSKAPFRELHLARVCYLWVASHIMPPSSGQCTWDVGVPLFPAEAGGKDSNLLEEAMLQVIP
jgi:hypothetical protein